MTEPLSILAVDDSELDRQLVAHTLANAFPNADIRTLDDPTEAEALCGARHFDCILLDQNMPQLDGLTLAGRLRDADKHLPIVLITSVADEMLAVDAMRGGVSDYLTKTRLTTESARRVVDRAIQASAKQRVIDQQHEELETFAYALAHDFKQPIRQIMTFSQMISEELSGSQSANVKKFLGFLIHASERLDNLVDIMVQYTLMNQPPELGDVSIAKAAKAVRSALSPLISERNGELVARNASVLVRGNETMLIQVLQNLVVNGLRYNQSEVPRVEIVARLEAASCLIEVSDNGIGIEAEYLSEIFKPLVRLHSHREYPGSGLGLTLVRKAVIAQKGEISCESEPGRGSKFSVRLPLAGKRQMVN